MTGQSIESPLIDIDTIFPSSPGSLNVSFRFIPGRTYRMPVVFGPGLGPRQGDQGRKFTSPDSHKTITRSVSFLTKRAQLEELLPEGFAVRGEPVATVFASYMTEI